MIRTLCILILLSVFYPQESQSQASCDLGEPAENMPEGFSQFSFIIGDFDIQFRQWTGQNWSPPGGSARWNGRYTLDGKAIQDWWYDQSGSGINIRMYDEENDLWKTAWHYTGNMEVRELHQKVWKEDGKLHLWQVYPEASERNVYFEEYGDGSWARIDLRKNPETGEWQPFLKIEAIPAECEVRN